MTSKGNNRIEQPKLYGLVLAGGRSLRMGEDKGIMQWHGKEQRYHMADMLRQVCTDVYISCRAEQQHEIDPCYKTLVDTYEGGGPLIAIRSAFRAQPDIAWLVVACDLPLLDTETLKYLIGNRDLTMAATTFESPFDSLPEPLITIWEPQSSLILTAHAEEGFKCPRKALIRNMKCVNMIVPPDPEKLLNANTPEDARKVKELMR